MDITATATSPHRPQRGPGVLVVDVSTIGAPDEGYWEGVERHTEGSTLLVRASFGPRSVVALARWTVRQSGSDQRRRLATLHLPYFNLADGSKSTDASLVVELIFRQDRGQTCLPPIGSEDQPRSLLEAAGDLEGKRDSRSSSILAVGDLDVQTLLTGSRNGSVLETSGTAVVPLTVRKGMTPIISPPSPESVAVRVGLGFSKTATEERIKGERRVPECVPTFFAVATTLFDCATVIKEAELRLYARCVNTGDVTLLSSDDRGAIVVHESFEWNSSADVSTLFAADPIDVSPRVRPGALILALFDKAARNGSKRLGVQRAENAVGMLELSSEDLESCGSEGRWYPLRASLSTTERSHFDRSYGGSKRGGIVGEALVSFSWLRYPAAAALPRAPSARRLAQTRNQKKGKLALKHQSDGNHCADGRNERNEADVAAVPEPCECSGKNGVLPELLVYLHVWDALMPLGRPDSALYITIRLYCPGSRGQRVSTKPVRGRGGLGAAEAGSKNLRPNRVGPRATSRSDAMHVVWDEHLKVPMDGLVEGMLIELLLSDASIDHGKTGTAVLAAREGDLFDEFSQRNRLSGLGDLAKSSATSARSLRPRVYHLKLHVDTPDTEECLVGTEGAERSNVLGGIEVRMSSLVVPRDEAASHTDEINAFLERKADVARIPDELNRPPRAVGDVAGLTPTLSQRSHRNPSRPRLLDLSAVGGLFRSFADAERDGNEAEETVYTGDAAGNEERIFSMVSKVGASEKKPSFEATLSKGSLAAFAREYFPGMEQLVHNGDAVTFPVTDEDWATTQDGSAPSLSFADFVLWLRQVPEEALGVAGLLATPRTVLHKTEIVMGQSTERCEELAATLTLAEVPTTGLVGGWCSVSLRSTGEGAALDRVRLGWGEVTEEAKERSWRRHLRMLRHDVMVLGDSLAQLEERCYPAQTRDSANDDRTAVGERDVNTVKELAQGVESEPPAQDSRVDETDIQHLGEKPTVITSGNSVGSLKEDPANLIVAHYLDQEAKQLGVASMHLKEALRCAGDSLYRDVDDAPPGWSSKSHRTRGRLQSPPTSGRDSCDGPLCRHHLYGAVLQHIKHVRRFQVDITMLRRRVGALLPPPPGEQTMQLATSQRCDHGSYDTDGSFGREAPRSALALVKRIRRAQQAARHPPVLLDKDLTTKQPVSPPPREQGGDDCPSSPKNLGHSPSSGYVDVAGAAREKTALLSPRETPCYNRPKGGAAFTESTSPTRVSAQPSLYGLLSPRSSSLRHVHGRFESVREAFRGSSVDLPPAVVSATGERLAEIADGRGKDENGSSLVNAWPAAAMRCPIDRFALHVFRTAGAAENGGMTVFTDMQELAAMGGLDTHASGNSLWATAARAGIVDVDRWVVAAVLWQAADAVETNASGRTDQMRLPPCEKSTGAVASEEENRESNGTALETVSLGNSCVEAVGVQGRTSCASGGRRHTGEVVRIKEDATGAALANELAVVSAKATSLWEELCREAFKSVLDNSRNAHETRSSEDSSNVSSVHSSSQSEGKKDAPPPADTRVVETVVSMGNDQLRQTYSASTSIASSFDRALIQTLAIAGRCTSGAMTATDVVSKVAATPGAGVSTAANMLETSARSTGVEEVLIYAYAIAGFADGSGLELADIVEAVKVRRQRAATGRRTVEPALRGTGDGSTGRESLSPLDNAKNLSENRGNNELLFRQEELCTRTTDGIGEGSSADDTLGETETHLVGIPLELRELFRAAGFADTVRKKQHQQQQQQQKQEGGADQIKLEAAELAVTRVLDSNRTLESAAFSGGRTALHHAAVRGDHSLVLLLLERGCKPHAKDFEGKRACDLTRDLKCLCLLGALKKLSPPLTLSLRTSGADVSRGGDEPIPPRQGQARAMISVEFSVSFRTGARTHTSGGGDSPTTSKPKRETVGWAEGIARWYDVRNKVLYIDNIERDNSSGEAEAAVTVAPAHWLLHSSGGDQHDDRAEQGPFPRHVLDVRLTSCVSPRGAELFDQLKTFAREWKEALAADMVDLAIEAAADLGSLCLFVFDGVVAEVTEDVAVGIHHGEQLAAAAAAAAATATAVAAIKASTKHGASALQCASTTAPEGQEVAPIQDEGDQLLHTRLTTTPTTAESAHLEGGTPLKDVVDYYTFDQLSFRCTAIITERDKSKKSTAGNASEELDLSPAATRQERTRHDRQYLARFTVEGGVCTVVVRGRSYLNIAGVETKRGAGSTPIKLEGRDMGMQRVLDQHGVPLAACLQTFDVMQDMEDPDVVLDMLAAGICQLSTTFINEGIEFPSLNQSEQGVLKTDVLRQLHLATQGNRVDAPDWDRLRITMKACGGVASVSLARSRGDNEVITGQDEAGLIVSPLADGWSTPEQVAAAIAASQQGAQPTPSPQAVLPRSAVDLIATLMGCNLCEVLGSLRPGTGTDGRLSLLGRVGHLPLLGAGGEDDALGGSRGRSAGERGDRRGTFRCSLEVAWNKDEGGVFVRRFGVERNEKRPRFSLRAVGIRGFSIAQLPVTLEDIDEVWDQTGTEDTSGSDDISSDPGTTTASTGDVDAPQDQTASSDDQDGAAQHDDRSLGGAKTGLASSSEHSDGQGILEKENEDYSKRAVVHDDANKSVVEDRCTTSEGEAAAKALCNRGTKNDPTPEVATAETDGVGHKEGQEEEEEEEEGGGEVEVRGEREKEEEEDEEGGEEEEETVEDEEGVGGGDAKRGKEKDKEKEEGEEGDKGEEGEGGEREEEDEDTEEVSDGRNTIELAAEGENKENPCRYSSENGPPDTMMVETNENKSEEEGSERHNEEEGPREKEGGRAEGLEAVKAAAEGATATHQKDGSMSDPFEMAIEKLEKKGAGGKAGEEEGRREEEEERREEEDEKEEREEGGEGEEKEGEEKEKEEEQQQDQEEDKQKQEQEEEEKNEDGQEEGGSETIDDGTTKGRDTGTVSDEKYPTGGATNTAGRAPLKASRHADTDGGEPLVPSERFEPGTGVIHNEDIVEETTRTPNGMPPFNRRADNIIISGVASEPSTDGRSPTLNEELAPVAGPGARSSSLVDFGGAGTSSMASLQEDTEAHGPNTGKLEAQSPLDDDATARAAENAQNASTITDGSLEVPSLQQGSNYPGPEEEAAVETGPTSRPGVLDKPKDTPSLGERAVEGLIESDERLNDEMNESSQEKGNCSAPSTGGGGDHNDGRHASFDPEAIPATGDQDLAISPSTVASHHTTSSEEEGAANPPIVLDSAPEIQERKGHEESHHTSSSAGKQNHTLEQGTVGDPADFATKTASTYLRTDPDESEDGSTDESAVAHRDTVSPCAWVFPSLFSALVVLSTAGDAVECTVDGEISLEHEESRMRLVTHGNGGEAEEGSSPVSQGRAGVKSLPESKPAWRSLLCTYKIARQGNVPPADIDLEDDDAQARLEDLLTLEYGLAMGEVLQQFRPETDLTCGEKVVQSFADSILQLRPSQRQSGGETSGSAKLDAVREAVGEALRGPSAWDGMLVRVDASRVLEVNVYSAPGEKGGTIDGCGDAESDTARVVVAPSALSGPVSTVDCSRVSSPSGLKQHLLDNSVPESAVEVLERAGFFIGPAVDVAGALAALAEETRENYPPARSYLEAARGGGRESPAVDSGRNTGQLLRLNVDNESEDRCEYTVAVTGTLDDINIEITSGAAVPSDGAVDNAAAVGVTTARALVSRLRACSDDAHPLHRASARSSASTPQQPPPSSREVEAVRVAAKKPGSGNGSLGKNGSLNRIGTGGVSPGQEENILKVGSRVEARFGGKSAWFPGRVRAFHDRGSFADGGGSDIETVAVDYDDGDAEENVPRVRVRLFGQKQPRLLNEGDEVDYKKGKTIALARVVRRSETEGHYDLRLLGERTEKLVESCPRHAIMALHGWPPGGTKPSGKR